MGQKQPMQQAHRVWQQKKEASEGRKMASEPDSSRGSTVQLDWATARRHLSLLLLFTLTLLVLTSRANAEHALSEVWSEADGLQMKYSTDHDDLLSTKGSELSLQTHGAPTKQDSADSQASQEEAAGGQGESAAASASPPEAESGSTDASSHEQSDERGEGASDEQASSGPHQSSGEQGADSRRQTDRVPLSKQYSTGRQSAFSSPAARYRNSEASSVDSETGSPERATRGRSAKPDSTLFQNEGPSSFESVQASTDDSSETANVDHGDDSDAPLGESPNPKFRPPGRLFKEAVHMNTPERAKTDESEPGREEGEDSSSATAPKQRNQEASGNEEAPSSPEAAGEPDFLMGQKPANAFRSRQKMIDFDNMVDNKQRSNAAAAAAASSSNSEDDSEEVVNVNNEEQAPQEFKDSSRRSNMRNRVESERESFIRPDSLFDQSSQRAVAASSPPPKERAVAGKSRFIQPAGPKQQLSYLRSVNGEQQHQARRFTAQAAAVPESPDSVRDNFISPGHYPGSMPHLTQAASELQKQQLLGKTPVASGAGPKTADLTLSASSASPAIGSDQITTDQQVPGSENGRMTGVLQVTVTPEPEAQPESQQIMAPFLMSTTTMAPMAATSAPADSTTATSSTSTTGAPTLERFKFRKYR